MNFDGRVSPADALGLINRSVAAGNALAEALQLADTLNARAPNALASIKELINDAPHALLNRQLAAERDHFVRNLHHANAGDGIRAFLDKHLQPPGDPMEEIRKEAADAADPAEAEALLAEALQMVPGHPDATADLADRWLARGAALQ